MENVNIPRRVGGIRQTSKGGKRPWENPAGKLPKVGDGVLQKTFSLESRHIDWRFGQGNQSGYLRALTDADIMTRSLPEH